MSAWFAKLLFPTTVATLASVGIGMAGSGTFAEQATRTACSRSPHTPPTG
jgi:hypothetical protein